MINADPLDRSFNVARCPKGSRSFHTSARFWGTIGGLVLASGILSNHCQVAIRSPRSRKNAITTSNSLTQNDLLIRHLPPTYPVPSTLTIPQPLPQPKLRILHVPHAPQPPNPPDVLAQILCALDQSDMDAQLRHHLVDFGADGVDLASGVRGLQRVGVVGRAVVRAD